MEPTEDAPIIHPDLAPLAMHHPYLASQTVTALQRHLDFTRAGVLALQQTSLATWNRATHYFRQGNDQAAAVMREFAQRIDDDLKALTDTMQEKEAAHRDAETTWNELCEEPIATDLTLREIAALNRYAAADAALTTTGVADATATN